MNLIELMKSCEQTKGQSVYQHGKSVYSFYEDLENSFLYKAPLKKNWKLPEWFIDYQNYLFCECANEYIMYEYLVMHDCGKPFCLSVEDGKAHFLNHAEVSAQIYMKWVTDNYCGDENPYYYRNETAALIRDDMCLHTMSSRKIEEKCKEWSVEHASTLVLSSLCELNSNASMFGGFDSTSFKIKFKQVSKRGKQVCKFFFGEKNVQNQNS